MGIKDELVATNDPVPEQQVKETEEAPEESLNDESVESNVNEGGSLDNDELQTLDNTEESSVNEQPVSSLEEEEEELEDPLDKLKEECNETAEAQRLKSVLDECTERVSSKESTTETCTQELFDFLHCVDHCASKQIFNHMK